MSGSQNDPVTVHTSDSDGEIIPSTETVPNTPSRRAKGTQHSPFRAGGRSSEQQSKIIRVRDNNQCYISGKAARHFLLGDNAQRLQDNFNDDQIEALKEATWSDRDIHYTCPWTDSWLRSHPRINPGVVLDLVGIAIAATGTAQSGDDVV
jgi:hypothetical protein